MRALTKLKISDCGESGRNNELVMSSKEQEINVMSNEEISEVGDTIPNVAFPSHLLHTCRNLRTLCIEKVDLEVVFEIETPSSRELATTLQNTQQVQLLPNLEELYIREMECMSHVWKCNWNKFLIPHKQQPEESSSSFRNLTVICLQRCENIKYLFSPLMAILLPNLLKVVIIACYVIEEVVSNRDDDEDEGRIASTNTSLNLFPYLDALLLYELPKIKRIGGGTTTICDQFKLPQVNNVAWSLCQCAREVDIRMCEELPYVVPSYALRQMQKLETVRISNCESLLEVFETQGFNTSAGSGGNEAALIIPRMKKFNVPQLSNLKELYIDNCDLLQHLFTFSTLESLMQLEKLGILSCKAMEVIVKEDNGEQTMISSKVVVFPRLKSIQLRDLPNLTGFFLGKDEFQWPLLDDVLIDGCPHMMVFTFGCSITPKLNLIHAELGKHNLECGLNVHVMATLHESPFPSLDTTNSCATTTLEGRPWSFHNLIEMDMNYNRNRKNILSSNGLLQLQKLEKIRVKNCRLVEEVFEVLEGTDSSDLQSVVVKFLKLREVKLKWLDNLKYIRKNNPWMVT